MKLNIINKIRQKVKVTILRTLPPCKEVVRIISVSLDRKLTIREKLIMKLHLYACAPCTRYFEQSKFLVTATHELDAHLKDDVFAGRLTDDARQRIKDLLKASAS